MVNEFMEEKRREAGAAAAAASPTGMRHALVAILSAVCLAVWFAPYPSFASDGASSAQQAREREVERASATTRLYLAARSVSHFRATQGKLPRTLAEAGVVRDSAIDYRIATDTTFTLATRLDTTVVTYDSRQPADALLGRSAGIITKQGQ